MAIYNLKCIKEKENKGINDFRVLQNTVFKAINSANKILKKAKPHSGVKTTVRTKEGRDINGYYKKWTVPVFVTNQDELYIYFKVWLKGGGHAGSCVMWCDRADGKNDAKYYGFVDVPSLGQFETIIGYSVDMAHTARMKEFNK